MSGMESIIEQVRTLVVQHVPGEVMQGALPFGVVCLVAGIGLSVLGAKLSRFGMTTGFALLGTLAGTRFAAGMGYPAAVCGLVGALAFGIIGYQTFRLWVGVAAAAVLAAVALGVFGYQHGLDDVQAFMQRSPLSASAAAPTDALHIPSPDEQQAYVDYGFGQWLGDLRNYVKAQDAQFEHRARSIAILAMVIGLCLGVLAVRSAAIVSTSVVGTGLVAASIATLLVHFAPQGYQALTSRAGFVGMGLGGFLVTSLIVQTMLTRPVPADDSARGKAKPKS